MQQSVNFVSVIPIKKRRFPVIESASPSSKEDSSISEVNKQEPHIFTAATDTSDLNKTSAQIATDRSLENYEYNPNKAEWAIGSEPRDDLKYKVDLSPLEEYANQASGMVAPAMIVKREIASERTEGTHELELSAGAKNVELPLEQKKPLHHVSELQNSENDCGKYDKSNPLLLSLVLSKEKLDMSDNNDVAAKNVGSQSRADRSNWDLNTSVEEWDGSTNNDSSSGKCEFRKTRDCDNVESSLSNHDVKTTAAKVRLGLRKGYTLSERSSNSCIASMLPKQQREPYDSLGLSLAVPFRELHAVGKHSFQYKKSKSTVVAPNLSMQNTNVNSPSFRTVKLEPISEVSESESSIKSSCSGMGFSNSSSGKQELVKKHNSTAVYSSSISPQKLVEHRSIKYELIHECNQESTASSSATTVSMTPQNLCSSKSLTCTELNISGDQHEFSFHSEEALGRINKLNDQINGTVSKTISLGGLCNTGNLTVEDFEKLEPTQIDGRPSESFGKIETAANDEEKINSSTKILEDDTLGSDFESHENQCTPRKVYNKEEREYEEGEVQTPLQHSAREYHVVDAKKINDVKLVECDLINFHPFVLSGDQSTNTSDYDGKSAISENHDETHIDHDKECVISGFEPQIEVDFSHKISGNSPEIKVDEKRPISATIEKRVDPSRQQDAEKGNAEELTSNRLTNASHESGTGLDNKATDSTLSMVEASHGNDAIRDSDVGNKSRIITLPRATVETSYRTRSFPSKLLSSGNGKERYYDFDGDMQPQWNRNEIYTDKSAKGRARDPSFRNSRPNFMRGRGRGAGRFGPSGNDWDSDNNFATETYNAPSGYRGRRHKHASSIFDGDIEHSGYRRKSMNDDKFLWHSSNDTIDPVYNHPQTTFDEFDGQVIREKRSFSTNHQKGYPRISSKSPVRYQNRRRSPNEIEELNGRPFRMRRMRSPDRASYREETVSRRRGSPSFVTHHSEDLRGVDLEHINQRSFSSNRSPPARVFPRRDVFDSRERGDVSIEERKKFIAIRGDGPLHSFRPSYNGDSDNFHFRPNDGPRPYRFRPDGDTEFSGRSNVREREFGERSNVREREFNERSNMQEREFDGRIKHQPLVTSRRIRDIEEQQDGNYRHGGRVWHDDGFNNVSELKRRKF